MIGFRSCSALREEEITSTMIVARAIIWFGAALERIRWYGRLPPVTGQRKLLLRAAKLTSKSMENTTKRKPGKVSGNRS